MLEKRIFTLNERQRALLEMQRLDSVPAPQNHYSEDKIEKLKTFSFNFGL